MVKSVHMYGAVLVLGVMTAGAWAGKGDDKTAAELKALSEKMMNTWTTGDTASFQSTLSSSIWSGWDLDMMGRPVSMASAKDVMKMFEDVTKAMKAMNATSKM